MSLKDFQIINKIGEGAYSTVYKVKRLIDNQDYAMKKVKMNNLSEKEKQNALNEVRILASINHPNIVAYKQAFIEKGTNYLYIVMEYADGGDLFAKIKDHQKMNTKFEENQIWSLFIQIVQGLKILHDLKILHRDIKSANVFLTRSGEAKLGDLNVSKQVKSMCQTQTGTPYYASPEIWKDQAYDKKSDVWSLGCVLYQTIALKPPFRANDMEGLYKKVVRGFYPRLPPEYSNDLTIILKMMLQVAPHLRSGCDKLLEFPILQKHMIDLPERILHTLNRKQVDLMRTIKIEKVDGTDDLNKKVELPKARYFSTIEESSDRVYYDGRNSQNSYSSKKQKQRSGFLPKINRTIDHEEARSSIEIQWNKKNEVVKKMTEPLKTQKNQNRRHISNSLFEQRKQRNSSQLESKAIKRPQKMYEGRLKQISPKILQKILKNEKEKQKMVSIIGNN